MVSSSSSSSTMSPSSTTTGPAAATSTGSGDGDNSPTSKPLLFFVALGFGVVFTNLWIIIGVKYCFRYNQRARQGLINEETGEPIDLGNMPRNRRRREKKLMSMEEVNERFPLTKYKIWRASREQEGLPAAGGVTAPPSRAASIKEHALERVSTENAESIESIKSDESPTNDITTYSQPTSDPSSETKDFGAVAAESNTRGSGSQAPAENKKQPQVTVTTTADEATQETSKDGTKVSSPEQFAEQGEAEGEEEDAIQAAVPTELLDHPGDACAICIENLDDDDEVRGLTCGHAFHAGCLDPWLTSRRACCPLCKTDYYVPKTRPEGEGANNDLNRPSDSTGPTQPSSVWAASPRETILSRFVVTGTVFHAANRDRFGFPTLGPERSRERARRGRQQLGQTSNGSNQHHSSSPSRAMTWFRTLPSNLPRTRFPTFGRGRRGNNASNETTAETTTTTPAQLEAGTR